MSKKSTFAILVLSGWDHREVTCSSEINDSEEVANSTTPTWNSLLQQRNSILLETSGQSLDSSAGQMENSSLNHKNLGAVQGFNENLTLAGEGHICCVTPTLRHLTSTPVPDRMNGEVLMCVSEQAQASA